MPFMSEGVAVRETTPGRWKLTEPLVYQGKHQTFTVPDGFETDFATVPKLLTWLVPPYGLYTKAAVLHDYLGQFNIVSRADSDAIFRRAMRELGVSFLRRWMMWAAVRAYNKLVDAKPSDVLLVIVIAIPSLVFLAIPVVVVLVFLALFWVLEYIVFASIKMLPNKKQVNAPSLLLGADAVEYHEKRPDGIKQ